MARLKIKLGFTLFCLFLTACSGRPVNQNEAGCLVDADCPGGQMGLATCEVSSGLCLCLNDNACDANEFCNAVGSCQARAGCESNDDCALGAICNNQNGECVELNAQIQCVEDSHCPFGSVCENYACAQTCRVNGDCPPGRPCLSGFCSPASGACNLDNGNHYCEFGQICNSGSSQCRDHAERSFLCESCDPIWGFTDCGNGTGYCLIDSTIPPVACSTHSDCHQYGANASCDFLTGKCGGHFCGASSCNDDTNPCPRGYACNELSLVSGITCASDSECEGNRACQGGGENNNRGYCSCISDSDCYSADYPQATCVNPGPAGRCIIGTTCGPADGLTCDDLRE